MKLNLWSFLTALVLTACFTGCSNDGREDGPGNEKEKTTYMSLSIRLSEQAGKKAADDGNYNTVGKYSGYTIINTVDIYLLSSDESTLIDSKRFTGANGDFSFYVDGGGSDHILLAEPFKTTPGSKKMIVIINSPYPMLTSVPAADYLLSLSSSYPLSSLARVDLNESASMGGGDIVYADVLALNGKSDVFSIEDRVSEQDVILKKKNVVSVDVTRIPSRAIITSTASSTVTGSDGVELGTISNLTWSVAQGANSVYLFPQANADKTTKTWGYDYFPGPGTDYSSTAATYYDYSDLNNTQDAVPARPANTGAYMYLPGKFFLENTHPGGADLSSSRYRKGNTAYVLVRAKFTPAAGQIADGHALASDGTFYVGGINGKIYSSIAEAQNYQSGVGVQNQPVATYPAGKVLYYIWLNPDDIDMPVNSPAIRNNIYHVNINSFKSIGVNWNPLVPSIPNSPNPDPKPSGPEPDNPVDPNDPLSSTDTYMNVDIRVLMWTVHTYDIDL